MLRIVLDTNVIIGADRGIHSFGSRIMQAVVDGEILAYVSGKIRKEYLLIRSRLLKDPEMYQLIDEYLTAVEYVHPSQRLDVVTTDREDNKFVEVASEVQADYIVSNDHDLLNLGSYEYTEVVKPEEFWKIFQDEKDPDGAGAWQSWMTGVMNDTTTPQEEEDEL